MRSGKVGGVEEKAWTLVQPVGTGERYSSNYCSPHGDCRADVHCTACRGTKVTSKQQQRDRYCTELRRVAEEETRNPVDPGRRGKRWDGMGWARQLHRPYKSQSAPPCGVGCVDWASNFELELRMCTPNQVLGDCALQLARWEPQGCFAACRDL